MTIYARLENEPWKNLGDRLVKPKEKGTPEQRDFLKACQSKSSFLAYMSENGISLQTHYPGENICLDYRFTENEFLHPEASTTQKKIWETFKGIDKETASDDRFWALVVLDLIDKDKIHPAYLALKKANSEEGTGLARIEEALNRVEQEGTNDEATNKEIDSCVRRILRSLCHPKPRSTRRLLFYDFSLGATWWRWHRAEQMSDLLKIDAKEIRSILSERYYGTIAERLYSGKSYLGSENVFGGLLLFLNEKNAEMATRQATENAKIKDIINALAYVSAWKAIELQTPEGNKAEIHRIYEQLKS